MNDDSVMGGRRQFARVTLLAPVRLRPVDRAEAEAIGRRLALEPSYAERPRLEGLRRPGESYTWEQAALATLVARLDALESAVGRIADALGVDLSDPRHWIEGETTSLSGSGLGARVPQVVPEGTLVDLELTLPGDPAASVRALGRAIHVVRPDGRVLPVGRFDVGIAFEAIHDEDREAVIRYTFRVQRAMLRDRKDAAASEDGAAHS